MTKKIDFRKIAEDCFRKAGGNVTNATAHMVEMVKKDKRLFFALMEPLLPEACYSFIRGMGRTQNQEVWRAAEERREPRAAQMVTVLAEGLLGWNVLGGKPLGECDRADLDRAVKHYATQASDMAHKARWLGLIRDKMPEGKIVREVFTAKALERLQEKAAKVS